MAIVRAMGEDDRTSTRADVRLELHLEKNGDPVELRTSARYPLLTDPDHKDTAENFSLLRTRLLNARTKSGLCSVLVTSAQKQEGKSFVSMNLAISLAQLGRERILLVDGDLRMKGITTLLSLQGSAGLSDYLQERASFQSCIRNTTLSQLWVTAAGVAGDEALPGILEGPGLIEFLDQAKQHFGLIVVDSVPASAPIADFELLLAGCDAALLVVQLRRAKWEALELVSNRMNGKLVGMVVNNTEAPHEFDHYNYARGK